MPTTTWCSRAKPITEGDEPDHDDLADRCRGWRRRATTAGPSASRPARALTKITGPSWSVSRSARSRRRRGGRSRRGPGRSARPATRTPPPRSGWRRRPRPTAGPGPPGRPGRFRTGSTASVVCSVNNSERPKDDEDEADRVHVGDQQHRRPARATRRSTSVQHDGHEEEAEADVQPGRKPGDEQRRQRQLEGGQALRDLVPQDLLRRPSWARSLRRLFGGRNS